MRTRAIVAAVPLLVVAVMSAPSQAAFPGSSNGKIAFASFPRGPNALEEIYTVNPDGTGRTRLTFRPTGEIQSSVAPAWNHDGTLIAFHRYNANTETSTIEVIDETGIPQHTFTAPGSAHYSFPAWSPDGNHIVFVKNDDVWLLEYPSGVTSPLMNTTAYESSPTWSPDGTRIAFTRESLSTGLSKVHVANINPATSTLSGTFTVTGAGDADDDPNWHPTKNRLALTRWRPAWGGSEIFVEYLGGSQKRITNNSIYDDDPAYSPLGDFLVWARGPEDGETELVKKNLATGNTTTVTSNSVVDQQPDWQPVP